LALVTLDVQTPRDLAVMCQAIGEDIAVQVNGAAGNVLCWRTRALTQRCWIAFTGAGSCTHTI
jgi:hypothetical protein